MGRIDTYREMQSHRVTVDFATLLEIARFLAPFHRAAQHKDLLAVREGVEAKPELKESPIRRRMPVQSRATGRSGDRSGEHAEARGRAQECSRPAAPRKKV
jgi:hypothetical protein